MLGVEELAIGGKKCRSRVPNDVSHGKSVLCNHAQKMPRTRLAVNVLLLNTYSIC